MVASAKMVVCFVPMVPVGYFIRLAALKVPKHQCTEPLQEQLRFSA
jgi:hypothetical protein